jgi:hypothetical protein
MLNVQITNREILLVPVITNNISASIEVYIGAMPPVTPPFKAPINSRLNKIIKKYRTGGQDILCLNREK